MAAPDLERTVATHPEAERHLLELSETERQRYLLRVRTMARSIAEAYYRSREALGFPLVATTAKAHA